MRVDRLGFHVVTDQEQTESENRNAPLGSSTQPTVTAEPSTGLVMLPFYRTRTALPL